MLISIPFLSSCKKKMPSSVLRPKAMEDVLYDYHLAQAIANDFNGADRYKKELLLQYVFEKHNTTQAQFDSSLVWYTRNTLEMGKIYENLSKRFQQADSAVVLRAEGQAQVAVPLVGDTVDIWLKDRLCCLATVSMANKLTFAIEATDTNFKARDSYRWMLDAHFLQTDTAGQYALMQLSILYKNDSIASVNRVVTEGHNALFIPTDSLPVKTVRGDVYFRGDTLTQQVRTLLLHKLSLMRYHTYGEPVVEKLKKDSVTTSDMAKDSLATEVKQEKDTVAVDSVAQKQQRLSPKELREQNRPQQLRKNTKPVPRVSPNNGNRRTRQTPSRR